MGDDIQKKKDEFDVLQLEPNDDKKKIRQIHVFKICDKRIRD